MVDVEVHVRGAVEDLPLVRRALGSWELRLLKVVPSPQPTSTSSVLFNSSSSFSYSF